VADATAHSNQGQQHDDRRRHETNGPQSTFEKVGLISREAAGAYSRAAAE
jgi:hypothetical protein